MYTVLRNTGYLCNIVARLTSGMSRSGLGASWRACCRHVMAWSAWPITLQYSAAAVASTHDVAFYTKDT